MKTIIITAKENESREGRKFTTYETKIKDHWYHVRFTKDVNPPRVKGFYEIDIDPDDVNIKDGKFYYNKKGEEKQDNPTLWISKVLDYRQADKNEIFKEQREKVKALFDDDDDDSIPF